MAGGRERGTSAALRRHEHGLLPPLIFSALALCSGYPCSTRSARRAAEMYSKFVNHRMTVKTVTAHRETMDFQAEVRQLLKLMIHSLYSNKEIFLRELISNASVAYDKLRFEALTDDALYEGDSDLKVRVSFDKAARTLTISDNGIGMNRSEVTDNLGTIAKSGTKQFLESLSGDRAKDARLIGQFGVGFYSGFIVADRITVVTRRAGLGAEPSVSWESAGEGSNDIEAEEKATRGTDVILH